MFDAASLFIRSKNTISSIEALWSSINIHLGLNIMQKITTIKEKAMSCDGKKYQYFEQLR